MNRKEAIPFEKNELKNHQNIITVRRKVSCASDVKHRSIDGAALNSQQKQIQQHISIKKERTTQPQWDSITTAIEKRQILNLDPKAKYNSDASSSSSETSLFDKNPCDDKTSDQENLVASDNLSTLSEYHINTTCGLLAPEGFNERRQNLIRLGFDINCVDLLTRATNKSASMKYLEQEIIESPKQAEYQHQNLPKVKSKPKHQCLKTKQCSVIHKKSIKSVPAIPVLPPLSLEDMAIAREKKYGSEGNHIRRYCAARRRNLMSPHKTFKNILSEAGRTDENYQRMLQHRRNNQQKKLQLLQTEAD